MTAIFTLMGICFLCIRETSAWSFLFKKPAQDPPKTITHLNTPQIIKSFGYPSQSHTLKTSDGYILEIHRIISGKDGNYNNYPYPVFMFHGLLGSSADFFLLSSENALPFLLADRGFDVWLGNVRGNTYCRAHTDFYPSNSSFWNFSFHESAVYDLPAQIDYVLKQTSHAKVNYIGFSLGTTLLFALTSTMPAYNDKVNVALLMGPIAFVKHIKSPVLRFLSPFSSSFHKISEFIGNGEFFSENPLIQYLTTKLCTEISEREKIFCLNMIFMIVGYDPEQFNMKLLPVLLNHFPAGYSSKAINHFSQMVRSGEFRQYDYGSLENQRRYGTLTPPQYKLSNVVAPVFLYVGQNDYLASLEDVDTLAKQLPNLKVEYIVKYPHFSHLDFLMSADVRSNVYESLINDLLSYSTP